MKHINVYDIESKVNIRGFETKEIVSHDYATIKLIMLKENDQIPNHQVPVEVTFYIIKGYGEITIGNETAIVKENDTVLCPANTIMSVKANKDGLEFLNIKTPGFIVKK